MSLDRVDADDDPSSSTDDDGFPPGVSLGTTHGGVRVLQIDDHPEDKPKCAKKLQHPASGSEITLIGSAHVSEASAREVSRAILEGKPDLVVIELDGDRLKSLLRSASEDRPAMHAARRVASVREAFNTLVNGQLAIVAGSLGYSTIGAVLDTRPGAEFIAAVEAARDVGATVVLGDRNQRATVGRLMARVRRGSTLFDELAKTGEFLGGETDLARADAATKRSGVQKAKHILEKAGCEHSEAVIKSALEILDSGLRGIPVRVDDLMRVRKCARRVVKYVRVESFNGNPTFSPGLSKVDSAKKMSIMDWATAETVIRERDLILATALQRDPTASSVVGVVGAGHIAGIQQLWDEVESSESRAKFNEYLNEWPTDAKPVDYTNRILSGVFGAAAFTTILRRGSAGAVKFAGALVGSMLTLGAVGTYMGASGLVALGRVAVAIEDASIRAAELGNREDSARAKGAFSNMIVRDAAVPYKE